METFSSRLDLAIKLSGYSRPEFAAKAGVGTSALAKWLSGKLTPKSEQLHSLSKVAGVTMEWLLTGEGRAPGGLTLWTGALFSRALSEEFWKDDPDPVRKKTGDKIEDPLRAGAPPDSPLFVSEEDREAFLIAFEAADEDGKIAMLGPYGDLAKKWPGAVKRFPQIVRRNLQPKSNRSSSSKA